MYTDVGAGRPPPPHLCSLDRKPDPMLVSVDVGHPNAHPLTDGQCGIEQEPMHCVADLDEGAEGSDQRPAVATRLGVPPRVGRWLALDRRDLNTIA